MNIYTHKSGEYEYGRLFENRNALCRHYVVIESSHKCSYDCGDNNCGDYGCGCNGVVDSERYYCENSLAHDGQHIVHLVDKITLNWDE